MFDTYLFADWSAANLPAPATPKPDTIWTAELGSSDHEPHSCYHRTRNAAFVHLLQRLRAAVAAGKRLLIGFDFPYGYPAGFAQALGGARSPQGWLRVWRTITEHLVDDASNASNRFQLAAQLNARLGDTSRGPFWGCPPQQASGHLHTRSPGFPYPVSADMNLRRTRHCEARLSGTQETWKLLGAGSVGSQALTGIPRVCQLRFHPDLAALSRVWPFETGFTPEPMLGRTGIVHAEIWPGVVRAETRRLMADRPQLIKDQAQVMALCLWSRARDRATELGRLFDAPAGLAPSELLDVVNEEGWVLGIGA